MEKRETKYPQLSAEERAMIMLMSRDGKDVREVARFLKRSSSTITRKTDRDRGTESGYRATRAGEQTARLRIKPRKALKLVDDGELLGVVTSAAPRLAHLMVVDTLHKCKAFTCAPRKLRIG